MRVVVVGLGVQGNKRAKIAGSDLVTTVDPIAEKAEYKNIKNISLDSYDAALVCTPDDVKLDLLTFLLENGKHILVEKPLLANDNQALQKLEALAQKNKVVCYTAYNHRFEPCIAKSREIIASGEIGEVLSFNMFYGNGTARLVRDSVWRDKGLGVLADLGSHLLDTIYFVLGQKREDLVPFSCYKLENQAYDHVLFGSEKQFPRIKLEATLLSWRNFSTIDIIGSKGSIHTQSFCKWSDSVLVKRIRVLPSGAPQEFKEVYPQGDPTWQLEYEYFKNLIKDPKNMLDRDIWINETLNLLYSKSLQS